MAHVIELVDGTSAILLEPGKYKVDVVGGWGVRINEFAIKIHQRGSGTPVIVERSFWPVQSCISGKRAKRIFTFSISDQGIYVVDIQNASRLVVKPSALFVRRLFQQQIPIDELSLCIY